jgi:hypothetical protein
MHAQRQEPSHSQRHDAAPCAARAAQCAAAGAEGRPIVTTKNDIDSVRERAARFVLGALSAED